MGKHTVSFELTEAGIDRAIRHVKVFKYIFLRKCDKLLEVLTDTGVEIAKLQVRQLDAVYTGDLMNSIEGFYSPNSQVAIIKAGAYYAVYVEFGTGVVGSQSPHPIPNGWQYDKNNHGDKGWVYYDEKQDKFKWTKGFKSRPFMYNTARQLEKECARIAKEVFGK